MHLTVCLILSSWSFFLIQYCDAFDLKHPYFAENEEALLEGWTPATIRISSHEQRRHRRSPRERQIQIVFEDKALDILLTPTQPHLLESYVMREGQLAEEIQETEIESCHWVGEVGSGGRAILSSCEHPDQFTGTIVTTEGIWLVRPTSVLREDKEHGSRLKRNAHANAQKHYLLKPSSSEQVINDLSSNVDSIHLPIEKLEAAAKLAAEESSIREFYRDANQNNNYYEYAEFVPLTDPYLEPFPILSDGIDDLQATEQSGFFSYLWKGYFSVLSRLYQPSQPQPHMLEKRSKADENAKKWVEIAVFTDESLYKRMEKRFPNDTASKLKDYATTIVNTMNLLYGDKSLGVYIGFRLVHLEVMKKAPKDLETNGGKAKSYLSSFCEYAGTQNVNSGQWDHALLLSGLDIHEQGVKSTAGLAWAGTMCYRYYSCSVAEGYSFGSAFIVTHEIGHSLGMEHDGVGVSETCDKEKYIMSPTTGPGKVTWSNCSGKNLQDFIQYGTSELRSKKYQSHLLSKPTCLSELVAKGKGSSSKQKLPGESYDAFAQCVLGLGSQFKPYFQRSKAPFNNICWILYCGNGTHAVSTHPALEGTKCDKEKYCRRGQCVKKPQR